MRKITIALLPLYLLAGLTDFKIIKEANDAYIATDYNSSIKLFNKLDNRSPQVEYDRGNAYYKAKEYDKALRAYERAKGVDEQQRLHNIGNVHFQKQKLDEAIKIYEKALKLTNDEDTKFNLELAKKLKKKKEDQKKQEEKNKKKKEQDKKGDKNREDKQDKQNRDGKKDDKPSNKEQDKKKKEKGTQEGNEPKEQKMTKEEQLNQKELNRLLKKLNKEKMPTMMYQATKAKENKREDEVNPW